MPRRAFPSTRNNTAEKMKQIRKIGKVRKTGKGTSLLVPLSRRKYVAALAPEVCFPMLEGVFRSLLCFEAITRLG